MRSGVSAGDVRGGLVWGARVGSWLAGVFQGEASVLSGRLSGTVDQEALLELTVSLGPEWVPSGPLDPFNRFGQTLRLVVNVCGRDVDFGGFLIVKSQINDSGGLDVTSAGLLRRLVDDPFPLATSPRAGSRLSQELQRLCGDHLHVKLDPGVVDDVLPRGLSWGASRSEAVVDLCSAMGVVPRVDADERLHVGPSGEATPLDVLTYRDLLLDESEDSGDRPVNVVTVTGKGTAPDGESVKVEVDQDFGASNSRAGWTSSDKKIAFKFPDSGGKAGGWLQALWNQAKPKKGQPEPAAISGVITFKKEFTPAGTKRFHFWVKSSTADSVKVEIYHGSKLSRTVTVGTASTWQEVDFTIPVGTRFTKFRVVQSGSFGRGHWLGIDEFTVTVSTQKTKEVDVYGSASAQNPPFDAAHYGVVRKVESSDSAKTSGQAAKVAAGLLDEGLASSRVVSVECVPDPRWEIGDPIAVELEHGGMTAGRVRAIDLDVTGKDSMRLDIGVFS